MTVLALKLSRAANAVSELHGDVSRHMWQALYPGTPVEKVPIGHITNGIHLLGWMKGSVRQFWREKMKDKRKEGVVKMWNEKYGHDWASAITTRILGKNGRPGIRFRRGTLGVALQTAPRDDRIRPPPPAASKPAHRAGDYIRFDHLLNPDALTIGFARRFATYKRAPLIFQQFDNIVKLAHDKQRPVQFIFAGKAHPRDDDGKRFIQQIIHLSKHSELRAAWCSSKTTTSTSRGRWFPAATSG
jgi:starch phosphorylase